jgi:hypothetical protein
MWSRALLVAATAYWIASIAISRAVLFVDAWREAERVQRDESWLRSQCSNATFYANMRLHTNVCETVRRNAARSPVFSALEAVAKKGEILEDPVALWPLLFVPMAIHALAWGVKRVMRKPVMPI